jgi:Tol biopolymer transport system component
VGNRALRVEPLEERRLLTTDLVSGVSDETLLGATANGASEVGRYSLSSDGRFAAFSSAATNLVANDTNGATDVFVVNLETGAITWASTGSDGLQTDGSSDQPALSADGRYLVFRSDATNLVSGDTLGYSDIFRKDLTSGAITRVSTTESDSEAYGASSSPAVSSDGRYVAFRSEAWNLISGDASAWAGIFVKDLNTGAVVRASSDSDGVAATNTCESPVLSPNGRYVAFESTATNLVAEDTNDHNDVFVKDLTTGETVLASAGSSGTQGNADSCCASISNDGRYVAFCSTATNLVSGDANGVGDVFLKDLQAGTLRLASTDSTGEVQADAQCDNPILSSDGRYVVFCSAASNLADDDADTTVDIFRKDLQTGGVIRVTENADVAGDADSGCSALSGDGRYVLFCSSATNLVDGDWNNTCDVFVKDLDTGSLTLRSLRDTDAATDVTANAFSDSAAISDDGRYVAFRSAAGNLVAGNSSTYTDIFLADVWTGAVALVSAGRSGFEANGDSDSPAISGDGRYVAFRSAATNLVTGDTNGLADIFVVDMQAGTTVRASTNSGGAQALAEADYHPGDSGEPAISSDGRYVAFQSYAVNLVDDDANGFADVFVKDLQSGETTRVSTGTGGTEANNASLSPDISGDGRYVAFQTLADIGDVARGGQVYRKDLVSNVTVAVCSSSSGVVANDDAYSASISADGRYVAFVSAAANLVVGDANESADVFVKDLTSGAVVLASSDREGQQASNWSQAPAVSGDGRFVTFVSYASDLAHSDTDGVYDVLVKDLVTGEVELVSVGGEGVELPNGHNYAPAISYYGRFVALAGLATNLVKTDGNGSYDVFRVTNSLGNTAPTDILLDSATIAENSANGTVVGTLSAVDANLGDVFTYTLVDDAGGCFELVGDQLQVADSWLLDCEDFAAGEDPELTVRVVATDQIHQSVEVSLTITIADLHDFESLAMFDATAATFYLSNSNTSGVADYSFGYGAPGSGWVAVAGDWNGDGRSGVGFFVPGANMFLLTDVYWGGYAQYVVTIDYAASDAVPLVGDWNGDGACGVGLYDPQTNTFRLTNDLEALPEVFMFSIEDQTANAVPLVGDWNGDGACGVGVYEPSTSQFSLVSSWAQGTVDHRFGFGVPGAGWEPLLGDWNGDRAAGVGLYDASTATFYLRDELSMGDANYTFAFGVAGAGWELLVGDWDGDGQSGVGLYDASTATFYLTSTLSTGVAELSFGFGVPGSTWEPLVGCWITASEQVAPTSSAQATPAVAVRAAAVDHVDAASVAADALTSLSRSGLDDTDAANDSTDAALAIDLALATL